MSPRKKSEIFIPTKHFDCNQLWRIQKSNCFNNHFKLSPHQLPHSYTFSRVINRIMASGDVSPPKLPKNIDSVRNLVEEKPNTTISEVSTAMNLFTGTVWKILRKTLRKYPYKPKTIQSFTDQHKLCRVQFCNWILQ